MDLVQVAKEFGWYVKAHDAKVIGEAFETKRVYMLYSPHNVTFGLGQPIDRHRFPSTASPMNTEDYNEATKVVVPARASESEAWRLDLPMSLHELCKHSAKGVFVNSVIDYIQNNTPLVDFHAYILYVHLERDMHIDFRTTVREIPFATEHETEYGYTVKLREYLFIWENQKFPFYIGIERVTNTLYWAKSNG